MQWRSREIPTFEGSAGDTATRKPAYVEVMELVDRDGNVVTSFSHDVLGATSLEVDSEAITPTVQTVYSQSVTLNDDNIKALPTAAVPIVAAPGSGQAAIPLLAIMTATINTAYTNINGGNVQLGVVYGDDDKEPLSSIFSAGWFGQTGSKYALLPILALTGAAQGSPTNADWTSGDPSDYGINLFFYNFSDGAFTGGEASNTMTVTVLYTIVEP